MDPQIDPLTAFYLAMAQAGQYAGKPGSQLNSGDLSSFFSPNLGLLTGTLTDTSQSDEDIYASVAPNISRVRNNPDADPIATLIVENLESGFSLPQTLIELKKRVSGGDLKAYQEYAKEVSKEFDTFIVVDDNVPKLSVTIGVPVLLVSSTVFFL